MTHPHHGPRRGIVAALALALITLASVWSVLPPAPLAAGAPDDAFSADRAFAHVERVSREVHVAGSAAATDVRGHIVDTLTGLGYAPQVREGIGASDALGSAAMAYVRNVVAEVPGTDPTGRLFLVAHYDSVQVSRGANDDGAGVAVLLETARILAGDGPPRNDIVFVFTDAEEACLCGAESFVADDALAVDGGIVLNFEARGTGGPPVMFETARGNAALVAQYATAVPYPVATSMAVEVYRILPNDTDFSPFRDSGRFTGLNTAYIDGVAAYHSPQDRAEYMDRGTLQAHGANALALVRQLGAADLAGLDAPAAGDATYFPVFGTLVSYPGWLVWPIALLAAGAVLALAWSVRRRQGVRTGPMLAGFALMAVPLAGSAAGAQLLWSLLVLFRPGYGAMIDPWQPTWYRFAVVALVAFVTLGWFALWRRRITPWALAVGGLAWLAVLGLAMAALTPGGSYLAALPALAGGVAGVLAVRIGSAALRTGVMTVSAAVGLVVLVPAVLLFFPALGLAGGAAPALFAALAALAVLPAVLDLIPDRPGTGGPGSGRTRRAAAALPALVAGGLVIAFLALGLAVDGFDERHPEPTQLMYALDANTAEALWASEQGSAHGWLARYVETERDLSAAFPLLHRAVLTGPASAAALPPPSVTVLSDVTRADGREITVRLASQRETRLMGLYGGDGTILGAHVAAGGAEREVAVTDGRLNLEFHAAPAEGVTVRITTSSTEPIRLRALDGSDGLAELPGFTARPPAVGIKGSHTSELVLVARTVSL